MQIEDQYIDLYKSYSETLGKSSAGVLNEARENALNTFVKLGFPRVSSEDYRNCDLSELLSKDYGMNLNRIHFPINPQEVFSCDVPNLSTRLGFILNDRYQDTGKNTGLNDGAFFGSLNEFAKSHGEIVGKYYNSLAKDSAEGMTHFNTTFVQDGFVLYVPANVKVEKPVQIIQVLYGNEDLLTQRRILVILEDGASARLLICDHTLSQKDLFSNQVSEIFLGKNANLEYYELEMNGLNAVRVSNNYSSLGEGANLLHNGICLSNGFTRNNINVALDGKRAEASLSGIALAEKDQFVDNHVFVDHKVPECASNQLYKYVLDSNAKGIFAGKIMVRKDAQKTSAYQSNKNLCADRQARMFTRPQLEIYADDVKCSHGSATGQIDENALFYMLSRGISEQESRMLLKFAFTSDVLDKISLAPLHDRMRLLVEKRFRGELARCAGCSSTNCQ